MSGEAANEPALHVRVAGFWLRTLTALIDVVILMPVLAACAWTLRVGLPLPAGTDDEWAAWVLELLLERHWVVIAVGGFALLVCLAYQGLFIGLAGQTIGQRVLRLRVIDEQGGAPGLAAVVLRVLALPVGLFFLGLGALWIAFDREARGFHDHVSGTLVVREAPPGRNAIEAHPAEKAGFHAGPVGRSA